MVGTARRLKRAAGVAAGFVLIAVGAIGVWIPFTFHVLGLLVVVGLALVLRSSHVWRRRFVRWQRRHPRWGVPLRRLLRSPPEIAPVAWHELLRSERWLVPRRWRRLAGWRRRARSAWCRRRPARA